MYKINYIQGKNIIESVITRAIKLESNKVDTGTHLIKFF